MATIAIKDLPESVDLDRQAMLAIAGGARFAGRQDFPGRGGVRSARIVGCAGSFLGRAVAATGERPPGNRPLD